MINAKEYLSKLRNIEFEITAKQEEIDQLKILATCTGGFSNDINVSKSKTGDSLEIKVAKYVDLEREINDRIDELVDLRHIIISEICKLEDSRYSEILHKRYVKYEKFEQIAVEMSYEYQTIRLLHLEALDAFQEFLYHKTINTNQH